MKRFSEQLNKKSQSIKLRAAERNELRDRLLTYMEYHPLPADMKKMKKTPVKKGVIISEAFQVFNFNTIYVRAAFGTLALFVIIGVPFVAERSLPGDVLYPVKVQFNEEVRSSLSFSSYAKVEWETERLERRIAEARLLASEGKLTDEMEAEMSQAVKEHSDKAQQEIASLREADQDEAAIAEIAFASALSVQSEVLEGHMEAGTNQTVEAGSSVVKLAGVVADAQKVAEESQSGAAPAYDKLLARVELETTRAYELFGSVSDYASPTEISDIERRLNDIERKVNIAMSLKNDASTLEETSAEPVEEVTETTVADTKVEEESKSTTTVSENELSEATEATEVAEETETETSESTDSEPVAVETELSARELLTEALTSTRKLISFMTDIDVRETVSIEELVPVTLTTDEEIAIVEKLFAEIELTQEKIATRNVISESSEKFAFGSAKLEETVDIAKQLYGENKFAEATEKAEEALMMLDDLTSLTEAPNETDEILEEEAKIIEGVEVEEIASSTASSTEEVSEEDNTSQDEVNLEDGGEGEEDVTDEASDV